jgi:hypothetical protein
MAAHQAKRSPLHHLELFLRKHHFCSRQYSSQIFLIANRRKVLAVLRVQIGVTMGVDEVLFALKTATIESILEHLSSFFFFFFCFVTPSFCSERLTSLRFGPT